MINLIPNQGIVDRLGNGILFEVLFSPVVYKIIAGRKALYCKTHNSFVLEKRKVELKSSFDSQKKIPFLNSLNTV